LTYGGRMVLPLSDSIVPIVTLSTVGFVVFLALPPIMGISWDYATRCKPTDKLIDQRLRFIFALSKPRFFFLFISLSVMYLFSGLLCLIYFEFQNDFLLNAALLLEIVTIGISIGGFLSLFGTAKLASTAEIERALNQPDSVKIREKVNEYIANGTTKRKPKKPTPRTSK
jgi:hypothetical protein